MESAQLICLPSPGETGDGDEDNDDDGNEDNDDDGNEDNDDDNVDVDDDDNTSMRKSLDFPRTRRFHEFKVDKGLFSKSDGKIDADGKSFSLLEVMTMMTEGRKEWSFKRRRSLKPWRR